MRFTVLCDLLHALESIVTRDPPLLPTVIESLSRNEILQWFRTHRALIDDPSSDGVALLSSLLPQRRTDRVYNFQPPSLTRVIGRCLGLGSSRQRDLEKWRDSRGGDLATCVERVLRESEHSTPMSEVTVEEVDHILNEVARRSRFSGLEIRGTHTESNAVSVSKELTKVYCRLRSREAKWFTRMVLKDFSSIILPENLVLRYFHNLLPSVMKVHDNFHAAIAKLRSPELMWTASKGNAQEASAQERIAAIALTPAVGTKIGWPCFLKARSIKHALQLADGRKMSLERKYDGEYCQIHITLQNTGNEIQIFSKSARDSTWDRINAHSTIKESLKLGNGNCGFSNQCILEGELLLWHTEEKRIMDFHKIRKHVPRSGSLLGTAADSQPHSWECLIVVFYDVLLVDGESMLHQPYLRRRQRLERLVTSVAGRPVLAEAEKIDFKLHNASTLLVQALAKGFARRWEGFVLKPSDEPYFSFGEPTKHLYPSCWIKLKKDYIPKLGDTIDLAIVGAGYRATKGVKAAATGLPYTHFHIGCLMNKEEVLRYGAKPNFIIINAFNQCVSVADLRKLCQRGEFQAVEVGSAQSTSAFDFSLSAQAESECTMNAVFPFPIVFELLCSGFDKPANQDYLTPRFPRLLKIHWDRKFDDILGFKELQSLAMETMKAPDDDLNRDIYTWIQKLEASITTRQQGWEESTPSNNDSDLELTGDISHVTGSIRRQISRTPEIQVHRQETLQAEKHCDLTSTISRQSSFPSSNRPIHLPTPPLSSGDFSCQTQHYVQRSSIKRRSAHIEKHGNLKGPNKRCCSEDSLTNRGCLISDSDQYVRHPNRERHVQPLRMIINSAHPNRLQSDSKAPCYVESCLSSSQKLTKYDAITRSRRCTAEIGPLPHSPSVQKTIIAFENTRHSHSSSLCSALTPALCQNISSGYLSTTIPTTLKPSLPNLIQSLVILSPCVSPKPYWLKNLPGSSKATFMTSKAFFRSRPEIYNRPTILIVESHNHKLTASFLHKVFSVTRRFEGKMEIWDWRVLEQISLKKETFVGCMWTEREGQARIDWAGGQLTRFMQHAL